MSTLRRLGLALEAASKVAGGRSCLPRSLTISRKKGE